MINFHIFTQFSQNFDVATNAAMLDDILWNKTK